MRVFTEGEANGKSASGKTACETDRQVPSASSADSHSAPAETQAVQTPRQPSSFDHADSIRINLSILDKLMTLAGELVLVRNQHLMHFSERGESGARGISQRLDIVTTELQETIMRTRMQPVGNIFGKLPRIVRDLSAKLGKRIEIFMEGEEVELDKTILESLGDPLTHLIRNCCDHGIETPDLRAKAGKPETGIVKVKAYHEGGQINIEIFDDGKGMDADAIKNKALQSGVATKEQLAQMSEKEIFALIMAPGFSTAEKVTDVSGRGVGMDVVHRAVEKMGGSLDISSKPGEGSCILMRMPLTLAIIPCLIVVSGDHRYAIPQVNLEELVCLYDEDMRTKIERENNQEVYRLRNRLLPMIRLDEIFLRADAFSESVKGEITERRRQDCERRASENSLRGSITFAVIKVGASRFGLIVDKVIGTEEIVVKPMHSSLKSLKIYSGATVMGDGRCALILDIEGIARHGGLEFSDSRHDAAAAQKTLSKAEETQAVLIFKNGPDEQFAVPLPLIRRIERFERKRLEHVGAKDFIPIEGVPTRVVRIDKALDVSPCIERDEMFLIIPKHSSKPFGILVSSLVDIAESPLELNTSSLIDEALLGTHIMRGQLTLYPDIYRLIERVEPDWFKDDEGATSDESRPRRILLAEDAPFFRQLVRGYLESGGYEVLSVSNGREALAKLDEQTFDLLVSDIEMPELDGWELVKAMRGNPRTASLPAIALTALDADADRRKSAAAGFNEYQVKIDREALLKVVASALSAKTGAASCNARNA